MSQENRDKRKVRRVARRAKITSAIRTAVRRLDEDDKEALALLIKRGAELLSDGELSQEDVDELKELVGDLGEARKNTP
jgi:Arc/MetJ-type ribon-helix-helix transcriptional regulator